MKKRFKQIIMLSLIMLLMTPITLVQAYGPLTMFTPQYGSPAPGSLYPRAIQTEDGRMYATFEQYTNGVSTFPIYESTDNGESWSKVGDVRDTHKGVGMRWEPHLYELPEQIGNMPKGTLLCAGDVVPSNRSSSELDLYKSNDRGRSWTYVSTIAVGGAAYPGADPVWEPCLIVANHKLICYYSDERDNNHSQKLVHETSVDGVNWSSPVNDVALQDSSQRPGMPVVCRMNNGNYIMTYEIVGSLGGAYYQISPDGEHWNVTSAGNKFANGACPYCCNINGTIVLSCSATGNIFINNNNANGSFTEVNSVIPTSYSRCLVPLRNGRLFMMSAGFNGNSLNSVIYGDMQVPGVSGGNSGNQDNVPGSTAKLNDGFYYIRNVNADKYLQVSGNIGKAGQNVELRSANGELGQKWYLKNIDGGYITLKSALGEFMIDVAYGENKDGANIGIFNAYSGDAQQLMLKNSAFKDEYVIATKCSGLSKVLDDTGNNKADGTNVCQWSYGGRENQRWVFVKAN